MNTITVPSSKPWRNISKTVSTNWDNPVIFSDDTIIKLILTACRDVNTPFSHRIFYMLENREFDRVLDISLNPDDYPDPLSYSKDAQILALIKKYPAWNIGTDPTKEAMKTFIACEVQCMETNDRVTSGSLYNDPVSRRVIHGAKRIIARILGDCPQITDLSFSFGPGSTYSIPNKNATAANKLCSTLDVTTNCYGLARKILLDCPGFRSDNEQFDHCPGSSVLQRINRIQGDRLAFVPKTALTDRPIAITGFLNSVIQKGIGNVIKERMRPVIDLRTAQIRHKRRARIASLSKEESTIDLKSASDTIAYALVMELLPFDWFDLLDKARSQYYSIDGKWYPYHKFSAMGNAYTFELETLIFYSLAESFRKEFNIKGSVLAYGDDLIVPSGMADDFMNLLPSFGFTPNSEKSFVLGNFRESCGGDYLNGIDVRPFYFKRRVTYQSLFLFHNFLVRSGSRFFLKETFLLVRRMLGKSICRYFEGPNIEGDGHLVNDSLPLCSFHRIVSKRYRRKDRKRKNWNVAVLLYQLSLRREAGEVDKFNLSSEKLTRHFVSYHRHI